ncbi:MAG: hypothetical protein AVDCRST_MAG22-2108, partial [uncultured Rubrobacteraceae bacterium]
VTWHPEDAARWTATAPRRRLSRGIRVVHLCARLVRDGALSGGRGRAVRDLRALVELVSPGFRAGRLCGPRGGHPHGAVRLRGLSRRDTDVPRDRGGVARSQHRGVPYPGGPLRGSDPGARGGAHPARRRREGDEWGARARPWRRAGRRGVRPHRRDHGQGRPKDAARRPEVGGAGLLLRPPLDEPEPPHRHHHRPDRRLLPQPPRRHRPLRPPRPRRDGPRRPAGRGRDGGCPRGPARPRDGRGPPLPGPPRRRRRPGERSLPPPDAYGRHRRYGHRHSAPHRGPRDRPDPPDLPTPPSRRGDARLAFFIPRRVRPLRRGRGAGDLTPGSRRARAARGPPLRPPHPPSRAGPHGAHGRRFRRRHPRHPDGPAPGRRLPPRRGPVPGAVGRGAPPRFPVRPSSHPLLQRRHHALPADGLPPVRDRPETELALRPGRRGRRAALPGPPDRAAVV